MKSNYAFFVYYIQQHYKDSTSLKILDYGCGNGTIVESLLAEGYDAYRCEYFGPGSGTNIKDELKNKGLLEVRVNAFNGINTGFDDESFDIIISNQVFEHIPELSPVLKEIQRILKPKGEFLNIFPHKGTIREAHCHILYAHRLPEYFGILYSWLYINKAFGLGRRKKEKNINKWVRFWIDWIPANTHYISSNDILKKYSEFFTIEGIEPEYLHYRLKKQTE